jgi:FtsP/CotA-like multicopper oxidase with cupredoxin domain
MLVIHSRSQNCSGRLLAARAAAAIACFIAAWMGPASLSARVSAYEACPRPAPGALVPEPEDLRSRHGVLQLDLTVRNERAQDGALRYCYVLGDGAQSPTLRLHPGDLLVLRLKNELIEPSSAASTATSTDAKQQDHAMSMPMSMPMPSTESHADPCTSAAMTATSTNLHFHGLSVPPVCHQDDVLKTSIQPGQSFEYRFRIPANEPPGLYWYHPHIHGFSKTEVLGGASGALIVEGIERVNPQVAGLPERVLIVRDQDLINPDAPPSKSEPVVPRLFIDRDGDSANNGTGFGRPAKDLSLNFIPVPYPDYPPAAIRMKPEQPQLWRVLNASAITYLNLAVIFKRASQRLGIVAIDGVPINANGSPAPTIEWTDHIGVPPGARVEFIVKGPPVGVQGLLVTRTVDTGQGGENDPNRALATLEAAADAPEPRSRLPAHPKPLPPPSLAWLGNVTPVRVRKLYFSEKLEDPNNPNSATTFYLTVDGQDPSPFDPNSSEPNILVNQGDVEDWIIENRSTELHAFHIHQIHFLLMDWSGIPVNEPFMRDTVNVPYFNGKTLSYPSVRLRMDFRDPNTIGTFVYHCHLLEHEDGGMMGTIRVQPANTAKPTNARGPTPSGTASRIAKLP